jgi:hypothetical protein
MAITLRNRIKEVRNVSSEELMDNERNWRTHPHAQRRALDDVLKSVGIAGALTAYYSDRNGGKLTLIDGHERRQHRAEWPVLILDVNDEEADLLLASYDPISAMAGTDHTKMNSLLDSLGPVGAGLTELLDSMRVDERADVEPKQLPLVPMPNVMWILLAVDFNEFGLIREKLKDLESHARIMVATSRPGDVFNDT